MLLKVGDLVLVFTAETQLSDEYTKANNLYRDTTLNADPEKKGYIEANRRVRAIKFRGHRSDALVMPVETSLRMEMLETRTGAEAPVLTLLPLTNSLFQMLRVYCG